MENVSLKLAETCSQGHQLVNTSTIVLGIFAKWLLYRKLDVHEDPSDPEMAQLQLARAWNFGAEFIIPAFQNDVMAQLRDRIDATRVSRQATIEAYRLKERGTPLQQVFVLYLASEMQGYSEGNLAWSKGDFTGCALGADPTFLLDLTLAMSENQTDVVMIDQKYFLLDTDDDED